MKTRQIKSTESDAKANGIEKKLIAVLLPSLMLAMFMFTGCGGGSSSNVVTSYVTRKGVVTEADLANGYVAKPHQTVVLKLESAGIHYGDTGGAGYDSIPYEINNTAEYQFCVDDDGSNPHTIKLYDSDGNLVTTHENGLECETVTLQPGRYNLEYHHENKGSPDKTDMVYIRLESVEDLGEKSYIVTAKNLDVKSLPNIEDLPMDGSEGWVLQIHNYTDEYNASLAGQYVTLDEGGYLTFTSNLADAVLFHFNDVSGGGTEREVEITTPDGRELMYYQTTLLDHRVSYGDVKNIPGCKFIYTSSDEDYDQIVPFFGSSETTGTSVFNIVSSVKTSLSIHGDKNNFWLMANGVGFWINNDNMMGDNVQYDKTDVTGSCDYFYFSTVYQYQRRFYDLYTGYGNMFLVKPANYPSEIVYSYAITDEQREQAMPTYIIPESYFYRHGIPRTVHFDTKDFSVSFAAKYRVGTISGKQYPTLTDGDIALFDGCYDPDTGFNAGTKYWVLPEDTDNIHDSLAFDLPANIHSIYISRPESTWIFEEPNRHGDVIVFSPLASNRLRDRLITCSDDSLLEAGKVGSIVSAGDLNTVESRFITRSSVNTCLLCDLRGFKAAGYDLSGSNFYGSVFSCLPQPDGTEDCSDFGAATLKNASLRQTNFNGANMKNADITGSNITGSRWDNVDLSLAVGFSGAVIDDDETSVGSFDGATVNVSDFIPASKWRFFDMPNLKFYPETKARAVTQKLFNNISASGRNFENADFSDIDFTGSDFSSAQMNGANFSGAKLTGVNMKGAKCEACDFSDADMAGSGANQVDMTYAALKYSDFTGATVSGAKFASANLKHAKMKKITASSTVFCGAKMQYTSLYGASLDGATFNCSVDGINHGPAHMQYSNMVNADLTSADFTGVDLSYAWIMGAGVTLATTTFNYATLDDANLSGTTWQNGASAYNASMKNSVLVNSNLLNVDLRGADLTEAFLQGAELDTVHFGDGSDLTNAAFSFGDDYLTIKTALHSGLVICVFTPYGPTTVTGVTWGDDNTCPDTNEGSCDTQAKQTAFELPAYSACYNETTGSYDASGTPENPNAGNTSSNGGDVGADVINLNP